MTAYFTPPHRLVSDLWDKPDAEISEEIDWTQYIPELLTYLDCTGKWDRVRDFVGENEDGENGACESYMARPEVWPPPNVVLLARASTQIDYLDAISLRGFGEVGWRTALLLRPVEEIELRDSLAAVDQIIVEPPPCAECEGSGKMTVEAGDTGLPYSAVCSPCRGKGSIGRRDLFNAIIAQVRALRGECADCGGNGAFATLVDKAGRETIPKLYGKPLVGCRPCHGTGTAPGKPALWVEGDEAWKERLS